MTKKTNCNHEGCSCKAENESYMFYSKVLKEPFESIEALKAAEEKYYIAIRAKEDKAAEKKADAQKVEDAYKALNTARKTYKEQLSQLTKEYSEALIQLKKTVELGKEDMAKALAKAEDNYAKALKAFTDKYEQYHITLRDGDFETTISSQTIANNKAKVDPKQLNIFDIFETLFR